MMLVFALYILFFYVCDKPFLLNVTYFALVIPLFLRFYLKHCKPDAGKIGRFLFSPVNAVYLLLVAYVFFHIQFFNDGHQASKALSRATTSLSVFYLAIMTFSYLRYDSIIRMCTIIGLVAGACAAWSLAAYFYDLQYNFRLIPIGRGDNQVTGASIYGLAALFALFALHFAHAPRLRFALLTSIALITIMLFFTVSRSAIGAYLIASCVMLLSFKSFREYCKHGIAILIGLSLPVAVLSYMHFERFGGIFMLGRRGLAHRGGIWQTAWQDIWENPLFGQGITARVDNYVSGFPHSILLSTSLYFGFPALIILLSCLYCSFASAIRIWHKEQLVVLGSCLLLCSMIASLTNDLNIIGGASNLNILLFWLPVALISAAVYRSKNL